MREIYMKQNNILMFVAMVAVTIALFNLIITINKIDDIRTLTGFATDIGTANLTIQGAAAINFTTDIVNWGDGYVNESEGTRATLDTLAGTVTGGTWTPVSSGLLLENIGNSNVTLNLTSSKNAASFIGGTAPTFQWRVSNNEAGSCTTDPSPVAYSEVNTSTHLTCPIFQWTNTADVLEIDLNITIPLDASAGVKGTVITATATAI
jgi:hypothetical protein